MTVYTCERDWDAVLTAVYTAMKDPKGHKNIRLEYEPVGQYSLFDEYHHVDIDYDKANILFEAVNSKISTEFYSQMQFCSMAYEEDTADNIYRMMLLGFAFGPKAVEMFQYKEVLRHFQICKRLGNETHAFREFIRFHQVRESLYVAHFEPKSRIVISLGEDFEQRMPSENFMIVDDIHHEAVIHPANEHFYLRRLNDDEFTALLETEKLNDEFTDLWKVFFDSIAIEERKNYQCQRNLMPKWYRKHAVEFTLK